MQIRLLSFSTSISSKEDEMNKRSLIPFRFLNATIRDLREYLRLREYLNAARG